MLRFGLRAHDFGPCEAGLLADKIASFGVSRIQLALSKAFPGFSASPGQLSRGFAEATRDIFAARGIGIAILGCYINPVHPDPEAREAQLKRFEEHLRFAGDFGCPLVGTETGSLNPDSTWHPETDGEAAFHSLCDSIERLVGFAERRGAVVAVEPVADQHTVSSIEKTRILLDRVDSPSLGIIFDPVNLIPRKGLPGKQVDFFERAFAAFGSRIVAVHVKDFRGDGGGKSQIVSPGSGEFDFPSFFRLLREKKPDIDVLLENSSPAEAPAALAFLRRAAGES